MWVWVNDDRYNDDLTAKLACILTRGHRTNETQKRRDHVKQTKNATNERADEEIESSLGVIYIFRLANSSDTLQQKWKKESKRI